MARRIPFDIEFLLESLTNVPIVLNADAKEKRLNEDPDDVLGGREDEETINWADGDSVAFIALKDYSLLNPLGIHWDIMGGLIEAYKNGDESLDEFYSNGGIVSNKHKLIKDLFNFDSAVLGKWVDEYVNNGDAHDDNIRSDVEGVITGRLWTRQKVVSFWNRQKDVIRQWGFVEKMFEDFEKRFGNLEEYSIDWVERRKSETPLTPASKIPTQKKSAEMANEPEVDAKGQFNFFAKLFGNLVLLDKLSDAELKKIVSKMHVLDPQVKAQVMKATGNTLHNKAAEIATKLGMSVAEFNSIWSLDESKINEDPNSFKLNYKQAEVLQSKGINSRPGLDRKSYNEDEAIPFIIDIQNKITLYQAEPESDVGAVAHPDMGVQVMAYMARPNDFKNFRLGSYPGFFINLKDDVEVGPGIDYSNIGVLQARSILDLVKSLKLFSRNLPLDGDIPRQNKNYIQGRMWTSTKAISFWSEKEMVMEHFSLIDELLTELHLEKEKMMYEFADSYHIYAYDELGQGAILTRSKEEMDQLMKIQHLDPKAKKKLAALQGNLKQKGAPNFDFQAQRNAAMPSLEGNLKLGDLLRETPDRVTITPDSSAIEKLGHKPYSSYHWKDLDAVTFMLDVSEKRILWIAADEVMIANERYAGRANHSSINRQIAYFLHWPNNFSITDDGRGGFLLEAKPEAPKTEIWFAEGGLHGNGFISKEDFSAYLAMSTWSSLVQREKLPPEFLVGRYWKDSKTISFWQPKEKVLKSFAITEDFLKLFQVKSKEVGYEFIDTHKVFAYDELFQEDDEKYKLSSSEVADLLKKQHTDPSAKKKLKDLGYYDQATDKPKSYGGFPFKAGRDAAIPALQEIARSFSISK